MRHCNVSKERPIMDAHIQSKRAWINMRNSTCAIVTLLVGSLAIAQNGAWSGKPQAGWLYVVDSNKNGRSGTILVVDPDRARIVHKIATGYQPDIVVSLDGNQLFINSLIGPDDNHLLGTLRVFDTRTGSVVAEVQYQHAIERTNHRYRSSMALSQDGRWLFMLQMQQFGNSSQYVIATFDTLFRTFLEDTVSLPGCEFGALLPMPERGQLIISCSRTAEVHAVSVGANGGLAGKGVSVSLAGNATFGSGITNQVGRIDASDDIIHYYATALLAPSGMLVVITADGLALKAEPKTLTSISTSVMGGHWGKGSQTQALDGSTEAWNTGGRWIRPQAPVMSGDQRSIYLGVASIADLRRGRQNIREVLVLDSETLNQQKMISPIRPFLSMVVSTNHLYMVDSDGAALVSVDRMSGREINVMTSVGVSPTFAVVAP